MPHNHNGSAKVKPRRGVDSKGHRNGSVAVTAAVSRHKERTIVVKEIGSVEAVKTKLEKNSFTAVFH